MKKSLAVNYTFVGQNRPIINWLSVRPLCGFNVTKPDLPSNLEVVTNKKINQILREDHGNLSPC